jgi:hypothetical protein
MTVEAIIEESTHQFRWVGTLLCPRERLRNVGQLPLWWCIRAGTILPCPPHGTQRARINFVGWARFFVPTRATQECWPMPALVVHSRGHDTAVPTPRHAKGAHQFGRVGTAFCAHAREPGMLANACFGGAFAWARYCRAHPTVLRMQRHAAVDLGRYRSLAAGAAP